MTDQNTMLPPALRRALELLADPPSKPDVSNGYLDLLDAGLPTGTPAVEAVSPRRSGLCPTTTCRR